ncbi:MAG: AAA family ATPase [Candidatus Melainabacteria bacterium]|nr:AAA family ATPase [Candidatus Melainabacteria bacterium]
MFSLFGKRPEISAEGTMAMAAGVLMPDNSRTEQDSVKNADPAQSPPGRSKPAPVIGILGAKGGVGATTLAINLAVALAATRKTTLIDTNAQQPDVALMLGNQPKNSLADLLDRRERLDEKILQACCEIIAIPEGKLDFVSPPLDLEESLAMDLRGLAECLPALRSHAGFVVLDLSKQLDSAFMSLIDQCHFLVMVLEPSLTGILAGKRWLAALLDLGLTHDRIGIAVNRSGGRMKHLEAEIRSTLPVGARWRLPNAFASLEESCLAGEPALVRLPRDGYSKAVRVIARDLIKEIAE